MELKPLSMTDILNAVKGGGIRYARYGDGEFSCMMGVAGKTCDGWQYSADMGEALRRSLLMGGFRHCYGTLSRIVNAEEWLREQGIDIEWWQEDGVLRASLSGKLLPFVEELRGHGRHLAILTGNLRLRKFGAFPQASFIQVGTQGTYQQLRALREVNELCDAVMRYKTVLFSVGPLAKVLIAELSQRECAPDNLIDIGSTWDMYVNDRSRSYSLRLDKREIIRLGKVNFGMEISRWMN